MYLICSIRTVLGYIVYSSKRCKMAHKIHVIIQNVHIATIFYLDFRISLTLSKKKKEEITQVICNLFSNFFLSYL